MDVAALKAFVRTVERGSVTAAARDLGLSQPAVTKKLRALEREIDVTLFERAARAIRPTLEGLAFYEASRGALATLDEAVEGARASAGALRGTLRISAPSCVGSIRLWPIVRAFQATYPGVAVDLILDERRVDLMHENFDLGLCFERPEDQGLVIRRIGMVERILAASPAYLARVPVTAPDDLSRADIITTTRVVIGAGRLALDGPEGRSFVDLRPVLRTNSAPVLVASVLAGHGIGTLQTNGVAEELADRRLVRVLPQHTLPGSELYLTLPAGRASRPLVRAFVDRLVPGLRAAPGILQTVEPHRRGEAKPARTAS